jgi:hypothetical protein
VLFKKMQRILVNSLLSTCMASEEIILKHVQKLDSSTDNLFGSKIYAYLALVDSEPTEEILLKILTNGISASDKELNDIVDMILEIVEFGY